MAKKTSPPSLIPKEPSESAIIMTEMVLPPDTNALGTIFGGKIMSWIDVAAAMAAQRHARSIVVTASIDALHFVSPVKVGEVVHIRASVNYAGRTSMEIGVRVDAESIISGVFHHTATAYLTFVALDENGVPRPVPPVLAKTETEKRRFKAAEKRRAARIALAKSLKD